MAMRGTITQQLVVANSDEPEQLIAWANEGIWIQTEAWTAAITKKPGLFALVPARFKTLANCTAAMAADPLLFPKVPEVFRTDEGEILYHCARRAKQVEDQKHSSAEAELSGGAPASPKPGGDGDKDTPVVKDEADDSDNEEDSPEDEAEPSDDDDDDEEVESSEDDDDDDDDDDDYDESSDDGVLNSSSDEEAVAASSSDEEEDAPLTSRSAGKRPIAKKAKSGPPPKRGRGPLYGYLAKYRKKGTAASPSTAAAGPHRTGIDLSVIETLKGAGRVFGKIFQIANDPGATEDEKANARRKMDQQIAKGDDNVLEALKILTASDGSSIEAKPGLEHVDIMPTLAEVPFAGCGVQ